ncbi:MAG: heterodisulfide reductase-related iron-sulfur binding cluster [Thermoflexales bacterium]|nr:heterodisulfide reductase-related iron-sulfur binding cluster [Thermoflexales bacterium]
MQHTISADKLGPNGQTMADAVAACVHCGFCLAACPTYKVLGEEMDSPRGRIVLMRDVLQGSLTPQDAAPYLDRCLGCVGCVTACPSGVKYGELITAYRAYSEPLRPRRMMDRLARRLVRETLPYPNRFRAAAMLGKFARPLKDVLPGQLAAMLALLPDDIPARSQPLAEAYPAIGQRRARVALLAGCVQQVLAPQINQATIQALTAHGVEVIVPKGQSCCGALGMHTGDAESARRLAETNVRTFPRDVDAIVSNAAGCGSAMKEYELLFRGTPMEDEARAFAHKAKDVGEFLDELGLREVHSLPQPLTVAYHDACHLAHAQGIWGAPRRLLRAIPNVSLVEIPEGEICCGSAGTYNIEHPDIADQLGERKVRNILATGAEVVATGNIGCLVQIRTHLRRAGHPLPVVHTMEILAQATSR